VAAAALLLAASASAQDVSITVFAYDQPRNTGYSVAGDLFADKLKELSKGSMIIDQYPVCAARSGAAAPATGQGRRYRLRHHLLANTATISPQAGVMSLHFLFRNEGHVIKALADPQVFEAIKTMIDDTTQACT